jgi:hypothetical protein
MNIQEFVSQIYLGDEGCKGISIDFENEEIRLTMSNIMIGPKENWKYEHTIKNGNWFFSGVVYYEIEPNGICPNDFIENYYVKDIINEKNESYFSFIIKIGHYLHQSIDTYQTVTICIHAHKMWIEDPQNPYVPIIST